MISSKPITVSINVRLIPGLIPWLFPVMPGSFGNDKLGQAEMCDKMMMCYISNYSGYLHV